MVIQVEGKIEEAIRRRVASGAYSSISAMIDHAVTLLEDEEDALDRSWGAINDRFAAPEPKARETSRTHPAQIRIVL